MLKIAIFFGHSQMCTLGDPKQFCDKLKRAHGAEDRLLIKAHATILKMGGHIREAARFTITLGANKISNFKGK